MWHCGKSERLGLGAEKEERVNCTGPRGSAFGRALLEDIARMKDSRRKRLAARVSENVMGIMKTRGWESGV